MSILTGIFEEGLIYALLALGVFITYRILDFPDLTVDSSFPLGAAVTAILTLNGMNPVLTLFVAMAAGAAAGLLTGLVHVKLHVRDLLSGIIVMTGLYSINLKIAGKANLPFFNKVTLFDTQLIKGLPAWLSPWGKTLLILVIVLCVKLLLDLFMKTKAGFLLRAVGDNHTVVTTLALDDGKVKILGLVIANALVALSGAVMAQKNRVFDVTMGTGSMVFGLAAVIIGHSLLKLVFRKHRETPGFGTTAAIIGSILYKACIALALNLRTILEGISPSVAEAVTKVIDIQPQDLKLITAVLFLLILVISGRKGKKVQLKEEKTHA